MSFMYFGTSCRTWDMVEHRRCKRNRRIMFVFALALHHSAVIQPKSYHPNIWLNTYLQTWICELLIQQDKREMNVVYKLATQIGYFTIDKMIQMNLQPFWPSVPHKMPTECLFLCELKWRQLTWRLNLLMPFGKLSLRGMRQSRAGSEIP